MKTELAKKCKSIKIVLTDVDGVLTDGGMYYSKNGEVMKKFNTRDGMAVELLHKFSIKTVFLTSENSKIAKMRAKKVNADHCYINIKDKKVMLPIICKKFHVSFLQNFTPRLWLERRGPTLWVFAVFFARHNFVNVGPIFTVVERARILILLFSLFAL